MAESQAPNPIHPQPAAPGAGATTDPAPGLRALERALTNLRSAIRLHLFVQRGAAIAAWAIGSGVLVGVLDYFLRMPSALRIVLWLVGAVTIALAVRRNIGPLTRFRPSLTDLALRVESSDIGRRNNWVGLLASGLELGKRRTPIDPGLEDALAASSAQLASTRFIAEGLSIPGLLDNTRLRSALTKCLVVLGVIAILGVWQPMLMRIGTQRVAMPWLNTPWPKRTGVVAAETPAAHPLGTVFPLRALLTHSTRSAAETRVVVNYRVVGPRGTPSEVQRALLTPQGRRIKAPTGQASLGAPPPEGELFEQLLDTQRLTDLAAGAGIARAEAGDFDLEFWFETSDDESPRVRVRMVEPPRVADATITVQPPEYARTFAPRAGLLAGEWNAGDGLGERSTVGPILAGSRVGVKLALSKDIPVPPSGTDDARAWLAAAAPSFAALPGVQATLSPRELLLTFDAIQSVRAGLTLTDSYGITSREPAVFRLDVVEDRAASAAVIEPAQDESVLATAVIPAAGEGRDDLGVAWVSLRSQTAKVDRTSVGAAPEPVGDPAEIARALPADSAAADVNTSRADATVDLADFALQPGDEVWLTAQVADVLAANAEGGSGEAREPVISAVRRLRIISESELMEQFRGELASLRDAARQMEIDQAALIEQHADSVSATDQAGDSAAQQSSQQSQKQMSIAQRLTPFQKSLERLAERSQRNNLDDAALKSLLNDAKSSAADAQQASSEAAQALSEHAKSPQPDRRQQLNQKVAERQAAASTELSNLAEMLSQGEDDWAVRRTLEKLLTEQRQLRAQTAAAGESAQGKDSKELTREQREDLERLARKQQELSQQSAQALDTLEQRARQMQETDAGQARAMQQAATSARQKQLVQKQSDAGQRLRQNQTGQAQQQQKQAEEALEEALENLDQAQQQRDEQLRRVLADIVESLLQLIGQQDAELTRLAEAQDGSRPENAAPPALDKGMMLVHQNTLGVLKKVRDEVKNPGALASFLDGAQQAQSSAVSVLRQDAADLADADELERLSLTRLKDALAEAQKQSEDADEKSQDQARKELRKAYREALELQVALKAETDPLIRENADRRTRQALRELGRRQDKLRTQMSELRTRSEALAEAKVFDYAHARYDKATGEAGKDLAQGQGTRTAQRHQAAAVAILQSLVEALKENKEKQDELEDDQDGGGGGGGGGGGKKATLPPLTELVLLRGMQAEAAARTRSLSEQGADTAELEEVSRLQDELSRQGKDLLDRLQKSPNTAPPAKPEGAEKPSTEDHSKPSDSGQPESGKDGGTP